MTYYSFPPDEVDFKLDSGYTAPGGGNCNFSLTSDVTLSGTCEQGGSTVQGATVFAVNVNDGSLLGTTTSDASGNWEITVANNQTVHVVAQYEDADGNQYNEHGMPYINL